MGTLVIPYLNKLVDDGDGVLYVQREAGELPAVYTEKLCPFNGNAGNTVPVTNW